ncbi:ATP-binding protein [Hymenobacter caeli]|uniref:histidine kinase n=1 Tax=Hymenobacter caeli TaxID=2735894 RepID=A0ABX2FW02_9BACT|nr:ATP-binding protein [Hymenobacter caeli]NRT21329.1 signal transduction histidine kinase [Hymenobacter caeli]
MAYSSNNGELLLLAPAAVGVVRALRRFLHLPGRLPYLSRLLGFIWVPGVALFLAGLAFHAGSGWLSEAYWLLVLASLGGVLLLVHDYRPARTLLVALGPYFLYSALTFGLELVGSTWAKRYDDAFDTAQLFAVFWLVAFVFVARGQKKTLEQARLLREEEEKAKRLIEAQNAELERLVAERTAALTHQAEELRGALAELRTTQAQLIQAEKMASLGELTAGIAHEIQNPLNFVNNFSEVSTELLAELKEAQAAGDAEEVTALTDDLTQNLGKIAQHGQRAASIVRGMLEHSRASSGERAPTDVNALADEYLRLAYHGLRAKNKSFNAALETAFAPGLPPVEAVAGDLGRVLLNLFTNAFYAVQQRQRAGEPGYQPTVSVATRRVGGQVEIRVADNGTGMSEAVQAKIFQPFFTTKPTGEGTGLGLSLAHDIVAQGHGGTLTVESREGVGTAFRISLPG